MSIIFCEKHNLRWDSDYLDECPQCENEEPIEEPDDPAAAAARAYVVADAMLKQREKE